ncbi:MAG TPA: alkaline phosphatase PhoX [Solimonas sp.]|nr:alkaline phosphatase PhoX [Solimonas sp.]
MQQQKWRPLGACLITACALVGAFALAACGNDDDDNDNGSAKTTSFAPVDAAATDAAKRQVYGSDFATVDGQTRETGYVTILRSGEQRGDSAELNVFGQILDKHMAPILAEDGSRTIADSNDFSSILKVGSKLYSVSQFESQPGGMYLTELAQDTETGKLSAVKTTAIDLSGINGIWNPCAGSVTPWNTHLGSEEYEANARNGEASASSMASYLAGGATNPYFWGFPVEVAVSEAGAATVTKHYSMGRFAHELSYVLPDRKTVYEADDGTDVALLRYAAQTAGNLSAGTLYAAKWTQTSPAGGDVATAAADISWIELGTASDAEVKTLIDAGTTFADIFTAADPVDGACAEGFKLVVANGASECLKLNAGQEKAAAFLETRRYAGYLGATTEFKKEEGISFDPDANKLYVAYSDISSSMSDTKGDIQVSKNACGGVFEYSLDGNGIATQVAAAVVGKPASYAEGDIFYGNTCDIDGLGNPDNISFMPGQRTLLIGEDASSAHQNDAIWAYNLDSKALTRIGSTPYGAETTSLYYYPDVNDFGYIVAVVQHPYGESDEDAVAEDSAERRSYFGYIGALPAHK